jgi:hypothetical protein
MPSRVCQTIWHALLLALLLLLTSNYLFTRYKCCTRPTSVNSFNFNLFSRYLRLSVPEDLEYEDASSTHRHARAHECPEPNCRAALLELLSDTQDTEYPIFREGQEGVSTVTLGA